MVRDSPAPGYATEVVADARVRRLQYDLTLTPEERLARAEQSLAAGELGPERHGLITAHFGTLVEVESSEGRRARLIDRLREIYRAVPLGARVLIY